MGTNRDRREATKKDEDFHTSTDLKQKLVAEPELFRVQIHKNFYRSRISSAKSCQCIISKFSETHLEEST